MNDGTQATTITTGEGVALDIVQAGVGLRIAAKLIDMSLSMVLIIAVIVAQMQATEEESLASTRALYLVVVIFAVFAGTVLIETATAGKSLGRYIVGTRVVRTDMQRVGIHQAAMRALLGLVEIWGTSGALAVIVAMIDPKSRRLGDLAAGTMVVKERVGTRAIDLAGNRAAMLVGGEGVPPTTPAWIRDADLRQLPADVTRAARSFLLRRPEFTPESRASLGAELAADLRKYVFPAPPPHVNDEEFIEAVLAERTRREAIRMRRNQRVARSLLRS
ncbi:MAG: RDD family protein [Actinomycetaceae bacterium]|nr:RDD family protein [Actinomycetaceae bacterium]